MISSLITWYGYMNGCIKSFSDQEVLVDHQLHPITDGDPSFTVDFDWQAGRGYVFVVVATCLKIVDVVCNLAVPTPTICRDHGEQAIYEVIALNRDVDLGDADEEKVIESVRRLRQSLLIMKEQSLRKLEGKGSSVEGGNLASAWPRLGTMDILDEVGEEGASSIEGTQNKGKTIEKDEEDQLKALEDRLRNELAAMDLTPSARGTRRGNGATSVYF